MFPPKKKTGLDVVIAFGKPKTKEDPEDLESPAPVEGEPKAGNQDLKVKQQRQKEEDEETPEYEQSEEYGAKLIHDLEEAGKEYGMDAKTTHEVAASFFEALANCLREGLGSDGEQE
jgi:hypothetical protein